MLRRKISRLAMRLKRKLAVAKIARFLKSHRETPASLRACLELNKRCTEILGRRNPLIPPESNYIRGGSTITDREISQVVREQEATTWTLPDDTINWLVKSLQTYRPKRILEFGSGVSTLCLYLALQRMNGESNFRLLSVEQDRHEAERIAQNLQVMDKGAGCVRILYAPLVQAVAGGHNTYFYDLGARAKEYLEWLNQAEYLLIDGPYAEGPCRYGTIVQSRSYLAPDAYFVMDDALRDKELLTGMLWEQDGLVIDGILTLGEGLLVGRIPMWGSLQRRIREL